MEKKDLEQIRGVVKEEFIQGFGNIWEGNIEPTLNEMQGQISQLPTKVYLDQKIADLKGDFTTKLRRQDEKINRIS